MSNVVRNIAGKKHSDTKLFSFLIVSDELTGQRDESTEFKVEIPLRKIKTSTI